MIGHGYCEVVFGITSLVLMWTIWEIIIFQIITLQLIRISHVYKKVKWAGRFVIKSFLFLLENSLVISFGLSTPHAIIKERMLRLVSWNKSMWWIDCYQHIPMSFKWSLQQMVSDRHFNPNVLPVYMVLKVVKRSKVHFPFWDFSINSVFDTWHWHIIAIHPGRNFRWQFVIMIGLL